AFVVFLFFFFSSRRRHTRFSRDWSSDVCSSDLPWPRWRITAAIGAKGALVVSGVASALPFVVLAVAHGSPWEVYSASALSGLGRSEERRVGKECGCRGSPER